MEKALNGLFILCFAGTFAALISSGFPIATAMLLVVPVTIAVFAALAFVGFFVAVILEKPQSQIDTSQRSDNRWIGRTGLQH